MAKLKQQKRVYSRVTISAAALLGQWIQYHRKKSKLTETELAERVGVSRGTIQRIEKGDLRCEIGLFFEAATVLGVPLLVSDEKAAYALHEQLKDKLLLLPKSIRVSTEKVVDDF